MLTTHERAILMTLSEDGGFTTGLVAERSSIRFGINPVFWRNGPFAQSIDASEPIGHRDKSRES